MVHPVRRRHRKKSSRTPYSRTDVTMSADMDLLTVDRDVTRGQILQRHKREVRDQRLTIAKLTLEL